jgi:hypothetical protein
VTDDTHTVTTEIDDRIVTTTARAAALDPATARVVGARVEAGELVGELVGEPV